MKKNIEKYFQAHNNYFWQWEEDDNLLAIPGGNTIAYRVYMADMMEALAIQGLPPFGSLLLAVIATNPQGRESLAILQQNLLFQHYENEKNISTINAEYLKEAISFLKKLSSLPAEYKQGKRRILVFQSIFQNCHNSVSGTNSGILVNEIKMRRIPPNSYTKEEITNYIVRIDLRPLAILNEKYPTNESIIEAMVGIPEINEPELEKSTIQKDYWIDELINESKTFYVGSLIKKLWGGLNIPLHYSAASQQPLGGVSDISNKGEFDKLLISEFANDDLVFLSRLANSEALYINREIPPQKENFNRTILIDISLRSWGIPKTIAYAIMLALAKHPKSKMNYTVWLVGEHSYNVEFSTLHDIVTMTEYVDPGLYPINGLQEFFHNNSAENHEVILITSSDTIRQSEMKLTLNEYHQHINYLISVDNTGKIDVYQMLKNSRKHLQSLLLNLEDTWKKKSKEEKKEFISINTSETHTYPLLLTPNGNIEKVMRVGEDYFYLYKGLLLRKAAPGKGWEIVFNKIGKSLSAYQVGHNTKKEPILLLCYNHLKIMELHNLKTGEIASIPQTKYQLYKNFTYFYDGNFYNTNKEKTYLLKIEPNLTLTNTGKLELIEKIIKENSLFIKEKEWVYLSVIYNIKSIAIDKNNTLFINRKHALDITNRARWILKECDFYATKRFIYYPDSKEFKLGNGVNIKTANGIMNIILKDGKNIHIPLVLYQNLAIAVDGKASGNPYFYYGDEVSIDKSILDILKSDDTWN